MSEILTWKEGMVERLKLMPPYVWANALSFSDIGNRDERQRQILIEHLTSMQLQAIKYGMAHASRIAHNCDIVDYKGNHTSEADILKAADALTEIPKL